MFLTKQHEWQSVKKTKKKTKKQKKQKNLSLTNQSLNLRHSISIGGFICSGCVLIVVKILEYFLVIHVSYMMHI